MSILGAPSFSALAGGIEMIRHSLRRRDIVVSILDNESGRQDLDRWVGSLSDYVVASLAKLHAPGCYGFGSGGDRKDACYFLVDHWCFFSAGAPWGQNCLSARKSCCKRIHAERRGQQKAFRRAGVCLLKKSSVRCQANLAAASS